MSTIKTNAIQTTAGKPILNSTGSILQVVQGLKTDAFTVNANTGIVQIAGLTASITPTSTSSKILISVSISHTVAQGATTYGAVVRRNGNVDVQVGDAAGSRQRFNVPLTWAGDNNQHNAYAWSVLDSPATTSSTTYSIWVNNDNSQLLYVNRTSNDADNLTGKRTISTITLFEISA